MQTFLIRYNKETVDKQTNQIHIEEKEHYLQAEDFGQAYKKAHAISDSCSIEILDINTITHDIINITKRIQYLTEVLNNLETKTLTDVKNEFNEFQIAVNELEKAKDKIVFQEVKKTDYWKDVPTSIWKEKLMPQNRKTETIELLNFLIEKYEKDPSLLDIRLGQLLLNVIPNESLLFHLESKDIQKRVDNFLKK